MNVFTNKEVPAWLEASGEHADIVLSSRIRLARNLKGFPFSTKIKADEEQQILREVLAVLEREKPMEIISRINIGKLKAHECNYLLERHLVSSDLLSHRKNGSVVIGDKFRVSMMINEEDHLRIQSIASGFDLNACWEKAEVLEKTIGNNLEYDFHPKFGYLTS